MKKLICGIAGLLLAGITAQAAMESLAFTKSVVGVETQTVAYTVRGEVQGVYVVCPSGGTGTVTIASGETTLFTKASITASAFYPILIPAYGTTGSALTLATYSHAYSVLTDTNAASTNSYVKPVQTTTSNPIYTKACVAGTVTATFTGQDSASLTNSWTVRLIYKP